MEGFALEYDLKKRTLEFSLRIVKLADVMDAKRGSSRTLGNQILRSGTSIGANLAEGRGAQSDPDFLTKLSISLKETYETQYWLELIALAELVPPKRLDDLKKECDELAAILTSIVKKLKAKRTNK